MAQIRSKQVKDADNKAKKMRYFIYIRKSTDTEDKQVQSLESQAVEMKRLASHNDLNVVEVLSESCSAKNLGRPVFNKMMQRIEAGEANGILVWKLDRLARNMVDAGRVMQDLQASVLRSVRTSDQEYLPTDNALMMSTMFGMSNQYSRDLAANVARGMRTKCEQGWYPKQAPLGYVNTKTSSKGLNTILPDPVLFFVVRSVFDRVLSGGTRVAELWKNVKKEGVLRMRGKSVKTIGRSQFFNLLKNPFYYGRFQYPIGSGNWYDGKHVPMITKAEYDRVQDVLGGKDKPRPKKHDFAFTGCLKCGECGMSVTAESKVKKSKNGNKHEYTYYHCSKKHTSVQCAQRSIEEKELIKLASEELAALDIPEEFHTKAVAWVREQIAKKQKEMGVVVNAQRAAYDAAVKKLDGYFEMRAKNEISGEELARLKPMLIAEKDFLHAELGKIDAKETEWANQMETALMFITHVQQRFIAGSLTDRKAIFSKLGYGSNPQLLNKKVLFKGVYSGAPVKELARVARDNSRWLEPVEKTATKGYVSNSRVLNDEVSARLDSNQPPTP